MTRYYIVTSDCGLDPKDSEGNWLPDGGELFIQLEPGRRNMSQEPATEGWLGTTNDVSQYAHGAFKTIELAQIAAADLGYTEVVEKDDP